jgi:FkbM family methyltransferase
VKRLRVFLDVGSHEGQTLEVAVRPVHGFDRIYAFEPMPVQFGTLQERFGDVPGVELCNYGVLAGRTARMPVYGANEIMEASLYPAKSDVNAAVITMCEFVEAAEFFREHIDPGMEVVMKLNCEGAEVAILGNLMDTGEIWKCAHVCVDFDVRRIPGMEASERKVIAGG